MKNKHTVSLRVFSLCLRTIALNASIAVYQAIRRRVSPTAIGRIPPSFLLNTVMLAPKRKGLVKGGT